MRVSLRIGKYDQAGKHNDRNFDYSKSDHIDMERVKNNIYWDLTKDSFEPIKDREREPSFSESERRFYREHFKAYIDESNRKKEKYRHKERKISYEKYHQNKRSSPEDVIIQIGDARNSISAGTAKEITEKYLKAFDEKYKEHCKVLNAALHLDEATPHIHVRRVWLAKDEKTKSICVSKAKCLERLKEERQYKGSDKEFARSLIEEERDLIREIARERGISIENEKTLSGKYMPHELYKERKREVEKLIAEIKKYKAYEEFKRYSSERAPLREQACVLVKVIDDSKDKKKILEKEDALKNYQTALKINSETNKENEAYKVFERQIEADKRAREQEKELNRGRN